MATPNNRSAFALTLPQRWIVHICLLILCIPAILPALWMVSTSFKSNSEITGSSGTSLSMKDLFPTPFHGENYTSALTAVPFDVYLQNTLMLCLFSVVGAVGSSAVVAYGFARIPFRGKGFWFSLMIATMALPGQVTMVPVFALFKFLGWYGTFLPLIVPAFFGSAFYVFLLSQFFKTLPEEMAESARVDGASELVIFSRVLLPLSKSALATCALFQFLGVWNDFLGPLLYLNDPRQYTVGYGLQQFLSAFGSRWAELMAATTVFTLPVIVLFFFAQKTFIQGISTTGGK